MTKKDISKILASGSAKQRYLLIAEDVARGRYSEPRILTDAEFNALVDSFKTPQEIATYNRLRRADKVISNAVSVLTSFRLSYSKTISELGKFALLWESCQRAEELTNYILWETKDIKERRAIAKRAIGKAGHFMVFSALNIDKEGYIKIDTKSNNDIMDILETLQGRALRDLVEIKSLAQAILDYMEDKGLSVRIYKEIIKNEVAKATGEKAIFPKYSSRPEEPIPWQELLPQYKLYPDPETPLDRKRYSYFKRELLDGDE